MEGIYILKLGGSIITDKKSGRPRMRLARVKQIAREIATARSKMPGLKLIILYGGGSYGHPLAHRFRVHERPLSADAFMGIGYTVTAMRELGTRLAKVLLDAGIPVLPLQTSSLGRLRRDSFAFTDASLIKTAVSNGGIPLLGGDVVFSERNRSVIVSADIIAVAMASIFKNTRILFATDTDGVYPSFPPKKGVRPYAELYHAGIRRILKRLGTHDNLSTDVTGAMGGKLRALLNTPTAHAMIFNGNKNGIFGRVLLGKKEGTYVTP